MSEIPEIPDWAFDEVAVLLSPAEMIAIEHAQLLMSLMHRGEIRAAIELFCEPHETDEDNYDLTRDDLETLEAVREKLDKAQEPSRRAVREWAKKMRAKHSPEE